MWGADILPRPWRVPEATALGPAWGSGGRSLRRWSAGSSCGGASVTWPIGVSGSTRASSPRWGSCWGPGRRSTSCTCDSAKGKGTAVAPEREMIQRISPFAPPVAVASFVLGTLLDGTDAGWSAAIAIAVVYLNFVAYSSSLALAATISPTVLYAVGLGGFLVRMGVIVAIIALLQQTDWFSIIAFIAALIPATIALLAVEMKLLSGRMQADLWADPNARREMTP